MCKVNFVSEFNSIMRYARDYSLSLRERMLWIVCSTSPMTARCTTS